MLDIVHHCRNLKYIVLWKQWPLLSLGRGRSYSGGPLGRACEPVLRPSPSDGPNSVGSLLICLFIVHLMIVGVVSDGKVKKVKLFLCLTN
jgi:hypothetical protein